MGWPVAKSSLRCHCCKIYYAQNPNRGEASRRRTLALSPDLNNQLRCSLSLRCYSAGMNPHESGYIFKWLDALVTLKHELSPAHGTRIWGEDADHTRQSHLADISESLVLHRLLGGRPVAKSTPKEEPAYLSRVYRCCMQCCRNSCQWGQDAGSWQIRVSGECLAGGAARRPRIDSLR